MAELRNINWSKLAKDLTKKPYLEALRKSKSLQWWLTLGLRDSGYVILDSKDCEKLILEYRGVRFKADVYNYPRMFEAYDRYPSLDLILPTDNILDLGANIGSYSLPAARRGNKVWAVEPIYHNALTTNMFLSEIKNLDIYPNSIGTSKVDAGLREEMNAHPLNLMEWWIFNRKPQIDVIRMDIGGQEWHLGNHESPLFSNARLLEIEFHFYKKEQVEQETWNWWKTFLINNMFDYVARWSKHKHWLYVSAKKHEDILPLNFGKEVNLIDGSFKDKNLNIWRSR